MINNNQNRGNQSDKDKVQKPENRKGEDRKREDLNKYGDVGYSGDSVKGQGLEREDDYNRINYIPDNDENQSDNDRDYEDTQFGTSGTFGYRGDKDKNEENNNSGR
jgi:hypothetical protein